MSVDQRSRATAMALVAAVVILLCMSGCGGFQAESVVKYTAGNGDGQSQALDADQRDILPDDILCAAADLLPQLTADEKSPAALRACTHVESTLSGSNTSVVKIICVHDNRTTARDIANAIAEAYAKAGIDGVSIEIVRKALLPAKRRRWL